MQRDSASPNFTHLNVHSYYTLLGATPSVEDLVGRAVADGLTHLALTDTNVLYGSVSFARACHDADIMPIIGLTVTAALPKRETGHTTPAGHLVLLANGPGGYVSLCRLSSAIQGRSDRLDVARTGIGWELLKEHSDGLVCLSGGRWGWVEQLIRGGDLAAAARYASRLSGIFGERAFLALELHGQDDGVYHEILGMSKRFGMPIVAVQPVFCMVEEERSRLQLLAAIDRNCAIGEVPPETMADRGDAQVDLHWLSPTAIVDRFRDYPDAVTQAGEIASMCKPSLPDGRPIWPMPALPPDRTPDQALAELAEVGLAQRYGAPEPATTKRLDYELGEISGHGYAPLFLLVADIVGQATRQSIPFGSRGSVANSLVAYCLGITSVDPISHDLLFERFLNPERADPPDIDLDFCSRRRDEILSYVRHQYGNENVALVATVATMRPKSAIRETGKAFALSNDRIGQLVKLVQDRWHPDPRRRKRDLAETLLERLDDEYLRGVVLAAYDLVGIPHHLSVHPGGLVVTPGPLTDVVPVQWAPKGFLITQFDHNDVEAIGLPKIDLLGIRALTVLADAADLIREHQQPQFQLVDIPLDDETTAAMLSAGDTVGVFQCESSGARRTLRQLQVQSIRDLAVANAFFKPGPATGGMARAFVRRYRGEEAVTYLHPALAPILSKTEGILLFQEQILRVATEIAGLTWGQADRLRRGMSKFQPDEMAAIEGAFVTGCARPDGPGLSRTQAETLWEQVKAFAGYGFNQGHATAYADVSYRSAYLKAHWPAEFICARLADSGGFHHQAVYIAEAIRLGIDVRPPHVNHSGQRFRLEWEDDGRGFRQSVLWMGLGQVRDLRRQVAQELIGERQKKRFQGLRDLISRVSLQRKELTHLIQCGALEGLGLNRAALLEELTNLQGGASIRQIAFDFAVPDGAAESLVQRTAWERLILGQPVGTHPLAAFDYDSNECVLLRRCMQRPGSELVTVGVRLPGWSGGKGWFLADEDTYVLAAGRPGAATPKPWQPVLVLGRWRRDEWGGGWFEVEEWEDISL